MQPQQQQQQQNSDDGDNSLLPEEIIKLIENGQVCWRTIANQIKAKQLLVDTLFYPKNEDFLTNLTTYYGSGADSIFRLAGHDDSNEDCDAVIKWLQLDPRHHPYIKHPLTGKTIWHLKCGLSRLLFPCKQKRIYNKFVDLFTRNSDHIEMLTDFYGISVYSLIQERKNKYK